MKTSIPINSHTLATSLKTQLDITIEEQSEGTQEAEEEEDWDINFDLGYGGSSPIQELQPALSRSPTPPPVLPRLSPVPEGAEEDSSFQSATSDINIEDLPEANFNLSIPEQERLSRLNQSIGLVSEQLQDIAEERDIRIRLANNPQEIAKIISSSREKAVRLGGHLHRLQQHQQALFNSPSTSSPQQPQPTHFNPPSTSTPDPFDPRKL